ncbi:DUF5689 domain-containing protein [Chitinophagaceae bacterium MMS25-I14]
MRIVRFSLLVLLAGALMTGACVKKKIDTPPDTTHNDPGLTVTHTIAQLKALNGKYKGGDDTTSIGVDATIAGIVVADDRSGNYYKQIVIQDSTGGIVIDIDAYSLYNDYPVGRKVYVKCKGLVLGYYGGLPTLGESFDEQLNINGISGNQIDQHIVKADVGHIITPKVVTLDQVNTFSATDPADQALLNTLITIPDVEFADGELSKTYTDPSATTNRTVQNCSGLNIILRSSNYANFHALPMAQGHGSITAIYTVYSGSGTSWAPQLIIRDTTDVQFYGSRCPSNIITMDSLHKMFAAGTSVIPAPQGGGKVKVAGVVISDAANGNVPSSNFIVQDGSQKGVTLYISGSGSTYKLGDSLVIDVTGATLQLYKGGFELSVSATSKVAVVASNKTVAPVTVTLASLLANFGVYESTLVKIANVTLSGGTTYGNSPTMSDGTGGTLPLFTSASATFATQAFPTTPKTYIGIPTIYNSNELKLRNPATDVQ